MKPRYYQSRLECSFLRVSSRVYHVIDNKLCDDTLSVFVGAYDVTILSER